MTTTEGDPHRQGASPDAEAVGHEGTDGAGPQGMDTEVEPIYRVKVRACGQAPPGATTLRGVGWVPRGPPARQRATGG